MSQIAVTLADTTQVEVEVLASLAAILGAIAAVIKFFSGHFKRFERAQEDFQKKVVEDGKQARLDYLEAEKAARADFLAEVKRSQLSFDETLGRNEDRYIDMVRGIVSENARQRDEDRKMISRLAGIDTGSFKAQQPQGGKRRPSDEGKSSRSGEREGPPRGGEPGDIR